jgi:hypothetical protein
VDVRTDINRPAAASDQTAVTINANIVTNGNVLQTDNRAIFRNSNVTAYRLKANAVQIMLVVVAVIKWVFHLELPIKRLMPKHTVSWNTYNQINIALLRPETTIMRNPSPSRPANPATIAPNLEYQRNMIQVLLSIHCMHVATLEAATNLN